MLFDRLWRSERAVLRHRLYFSLSNASDSPSISICTSARMPNTLLAILRNRVIASLARNISARARLLDGKYNRTSGPSILHPVACATSSPRNFCSREMARLMASALVCACSIVGCICRTSTRLRLASARTISRISTISRFPREPSSSTSSRTRTAATKRRRPSCKRCSS